jgi:phosphoglycolate phosphatase
LKRWDTIRRYLPMLLVALGFILFVIGGLGRSGPDPSQSPMAAVQAIGTILIGIGVLWLTMSRVIQTARRAVGEPERKIVALLFDLDGTLTDPHEGITNCIRYAMQELGHAPPPADELRWCIGPPLRENFARLLDTNDPGLLDKAVSLYRDRFGEKGMYENAMFSDVEEALGDIQACGFRMFVASSKPLVYVRKILSHFDLKKYFDGVYGSELNGDRTDKGDLIRHVLEAESLDPATTLMVGDREHDVIGARKCGVRSAAVTYGYGTRDELDEARPDYLFDSLLEVAKFLEAMR